MPASATLRIGFSAKKTAGFIVRVGKNAWRLVDNGKLTFERKFDVNVGDKTMFWIGMVPL